MRFVSILLMTGMMAGCATNSTPEPKAKPAPQAKSKEYQKCESARRNMRLPSGQKPGRAVALKLADPENVELKTPACALLVYDVLADGKADNVRIMKISPANPEFGQKAAMALLNSEFEQKPAKNVVHIVDYIPPQ